MSPKLGTIVPNPLRVIRRNFDHTQSAALKSGVTVYTPAVGDVLYDAMIITETAFNGTTPLADLFVGDLSSVGFFSGSGPGPGPNIVDLTIVPNLVGDGAFLTNGLPSLQQLAGNTLTSFGPFGTFKTTDPLVLVATQDGTPSGDPIDSTAGAATLFLVVFTPTG